MRNFPTTLLLALVATVATNSTLALAGSCDIDDLQTPSWIIGGSPNDVNLISETGQFPGPFRAVITFSKEPAENPCGFHPPGTGHRYARLTLPSCYDFEVLIEYDLFTYDHWDPTDIDSSDVFYAHIGPQPGPTNLSSLYSVSCHQTGFNSSKSEYTRWWGSNSIACPSTTPCENSGVWFQRVAGHSQGNHVITVGLNTGFLYFSYGMFIITVVPSHIDLVDPNSDPGAQATTLISDGTIINNPDRWSTEGTPRIGLAADGSTRLVLRRPTVGPGTVDFSINELLPKPDGFSGSLSTLGGYEETDVLTGVPAVNVGGDKWMAFAVYKAPNDFNFGGHSGAATRVVEIEAHYTHPVEMVSSVARLNVVVVRPPVVLSTGCGRTRIPGNGDYSATSDFRCMLMIIVEPTLGPTQPTKHSRQLLPRRRLIHCA